MTLPAYPKYKPSGVEWLGEIPQEWEVKRVKFLGDFKSGENITTLELDENGDYPVYGGNGIRGNAVSYTHEGEHILIGRQGAHCGNVHLAAGKFWASEHAVVVSPNTEYDAFWLMQTLHIMNLNQYSVSAAQPGIAVDVITNLSVPVPDLSEQKYIASYLDQKTGQIDELIGKKKELIERLKEQRTAIITHAVTKGLDTSVPMKDSGVEWLGDVPEHWSIRRIKECARTISKGTTPSTEGMEILQEGAVRFIKAENISGGKIVDEPRCFIDEKTNTILSRSNLQAGDVLFVIAGATLGKITIVKRRHLPANTNQAVAFIRPSEWVKSSFITYWFETHLLRSQGLIPRCLQRFRVEHILNEWEN